MNKPITIIVPSYNNSRWYLGNLTSICAQNYDNYKIIYTDDCSTDATVGLVEKFIDENDLRDKFKLIKNTVRKGAMENLYDMIHSQSNETICVLVDGDDNLKYNDVLKVVNEAYQDPNIWLTYGSYVDMPGNTRGCAKPYEQSVIDSNRYRYVPWRASHLRTFYAGLFKKIKKEDMMYGTKFYNSGWDLSFMLPSLELTGGKFKYIDEILYEYSNLNPISDYKINAQEQASMDGHIRRRPRYNKLDKLF